jgi:DNA-binding Lrp family transcriptional regulator
LRRFKIDVVFDLHTRNRDETFPGIDSAHAVHDESFREFSEEEKKLVRALDQNIPLVGQPFAAVAKKTGQTEEAVLSTLQKWKEQGVLRRIGAILYHREAGFKANAMCVWPVSGDVSAAGRRVAARPEVSHCYQRPCLERFPFDLYAMIHTGSWEQTDALFKDISLTCGLSNGQLFASGREFKKSSMQYFQS